jgi:predicted nucleic-acid-binding Zn-ribbon protein
MSGAKIDTYHCAHCNKEVPWYQQGDPDERRADYAMKTCATCRQIAQTRAAAKAARIAKLPRPAAPCACGCAEFICAPLREHSGEYERLMSLRFGASSKRSGDELWTVACRACGRTELYVPNIAAIQPDPDEDIHAVSVAAAAPYR